MKLVNQTLFWGHALIIVGALGLAWFLPPYVVVGMIILHELQFAIIGGCVVSYAQVATGDLKHDENYLQALLERVFSIDITKQDARKLDISIKTAMLLLSLIGWSL